MTRNLLRSGLLFAVTINCVAMMGVGGCPSNLQNGGLVDTTRAGIYVANYGSNTVTVYALDADGDAAPMRSIAGPNTGLSQPIGIAKDTQSHLYVTNRSGSTVGVFPIDGYGDIAPDRTLTDPNMGSPEGICVGSGDDVFVTNCPSCGSGAGGQVGVFHFANNATTSDYVIGGGSNFNTGLTVPDGVALDAGHNVYVSNAFGGTVNVYGPNSQGDQLPIRSFSPGGNIQAIAYGSNSIFLSYPGTGIVQYLGTAAGATPASGVLAPDALQYPGCIAVDDSVLPPVVYLTDYSGNAIYVIHTSGTAPFLTVDSVTTITGPTTGLSGPLGIMVVKP